MPTGHSYQETERTYIGVVSQCKFLIILFCHNLFCSLLYLANVFEKCLAFINIFGKVLWI